MQRSTNEFHSLGISPIHLLNDFLTKSLVDTGNEEPLPIVTRTLLPLSRISSYYDTKRCFICNHEFLHTANEFEIIQHVETCLISAGIYDPGVPIEPKQYACPNCTRQFPGDEEKAYLQHLADCFAGNFENFT